MKKVFTEFFAAILLLFFVALVTAVGIIGYAASFAVPAAAIVWVLRCFGIV